MKSRFIIRGYLKLNLLLERVGVRRIKSTAYIPFIPAFSLCRRGSRTCVNTHALEGRGDS
jgi:hypothetical protein